MFKPLVALALLAIASGHELDRAAGTWETLKIFSTNVTADAGVDNEELNLFIYLFMARLKLSIAPMEGSFKCERDGEETTFPAVNLTLTTRKAGESSETIAYKTNLPMKILRIGDEIEDLTRPTFMCPHLGGLYRGPVHVLRFINDDYVVVYYSYGYVSLMSKLQPNEDSVKRVVESDPVLKAAREVQSFMPIRS